MRVAAAATDRPAVRAVNPLQSSCWDDRIAEWPDATFFHSAGWARLLDAAYGFKPIFLTASDGRRNALLPLMEVDSWITGRRGVSLPFSDECPVLADDESAREALFEAAKTCARVRRWRYLELRGGREGLGRAPASSRYYGHSLKLHEDVQRLFSDCDSAVRRAVRKAAASDLQIEFRRSPESVRTFHALLCKTRQRHGVPPQPAAFFEQLHRHVLAHNRGWVVLATLKGLAVAGAVFLHFGRSAVYKYGASDDAYQELRPNNLVMWRAIEWYARAGYSTLDFGRTAMENEGLRRFKLGWGTRERLIEYVRYNCRAHAFASLTPESSPWQRRLFRNLPTPLLRLIGTAAYRHVG